MRFAINFLSLITQILETMKKFTLAIAMISLLASCTAEDNKQSAPINAPKTAKLAEKVTFVQDDNQSFTLDYNANHTLKSAVSDNQELAYELSYENGQISNVSGTDDGQSFDVDFTYDINGVITGVTMNGQAKIIAYNSQGRYYEIKDNAETLRKVRFVLNSNADLEEIVTFNNIGNFNDGTAFYYQNDQKGPLYNAANRVTLQLAIACRARAMLSCSFGGYRPFKLYAGAHIPQVGLQNTCDAEGYVLQSDKEEDQMDYANFTYTEI